MSYVFFKFDAKQSDDERINALALLFLTQASKLKAIEHLFFRPADDETKQTAAELVRIIASKELGGIPTVCIKFPTDFETDKHLIASFKKDYLGCVSSKCKKDELVKMVQLYKKIDAYDENLRNCFSVASNFATKWKNGKIIAFANHPPYIDEAEYKQLVALHNKCIQPVMTDIDNSVAKIKAQLAAYPKLVRRKF